MEEKCAVTHDALAHMCAVSRFFCLADTLEGVVKRSEALSLVFWSLTGKIGCH